MTINIALATSEAVIIGCDSVASTSRYFLDPIRLDWEKGPDGKFLMDAAGKFTLKFDPTDYESVVTDAWGGVTKMFQIHPMPSPAVAVTAGLAKMKDRPISSWATEFYEKNKKRDKKLIKCDVICKQFLEFMHGIYEDHYKGSVLPKQLREGPEFLVGGHGRDDDLPSIYRIKVAENVVTYEFGAGGKVGKAGVAWNGQSDAVERFLRGYDGMVRHNVQRAIGAALGGHSQAVKVYVANAINEILDKLNQKMPTDVKIEIPELKEIKVNWDEHEASIDYSNMPLQEAINFVAFLVLLQEGKSRFARGVGTVGGRTHVGVVTKGKDFELLEEPKLTHRYTGFADAQ